MSTGSVLVVCVRTCLARDGYMAQLCQHIATMEGCLGALGACLFRLMQLQQPPKTQDPRPSPREQSRHSRVEQTTRLEAVQLYVALQVVRVRQSLLRDRRRKAASWKVYCPGQLITRKSSKIGKETIPFHTKCRDLRCIQVFVGVHGPMAPAEKSLLSPKLRCGPRKSNSPGARIVTVVSSSAIDACRMCIT